MAERRDSDKGRRFGWWAVVAGALLGVLGQAAVEFIIHAVGGQVITNAAWFSGTTLLVLIVLILLIRELGNQVFGLYKKTDELEQKSRFSIRYYPLDPGAPPQERNLQAERLYGEARRVIEYAAQGGESKILAVNSFVEIGGQVGDERVMEYSRSYLNAIDRKLGKVRYHRIIQLAQDDLAVLPGGSVAHLVAPNYCDHYRNMLRVPGNSRGQQAAVLEAVPARYPTSYLLVQNKEDGAYGGQLIWQMHEHVDDGERDDTVQLTGLFIVIDPNGSMLRTFVEWFEELQKLSPTYRLTIDNLALDPVAEPADPPEQLPNGGTGRYSWRRNRN